MKIVYISSSKIPSRYANSVHVMKMCQAFAKNGHKVILLAPDDPDARGVDLKDIYNYYGVDKVFELIKIFLLPIKGKGYLYSFLAALKSKKHLPDLVYGRNLQGCYFSALLGLPVVYESHQPDDDMSIIYRWMLSSLVKKDNLKRLIVISEALKDYYLDSYPMLAENIFVAHDGADMPVSKKVSLKPTGKIQVGYIGHLYPGRGVELILELAQKCPWAVFHVIGGTEEDIVFWQARNDLSNLIIHGHMPYTKAEQYRLAFDVLLAPYQKEVYVPGGGNTAKWMSPLKIFEYMAAGKPIICSDLPVLREVLIHGKNALLCNPDDTNEWINCLKRLRDDEELRRSLGSAAYKDFIDNHTWSVRAKKVID